MESTKQRTLINVSRTSHEILDLKGETSKMLSLMNVIVNQSEIKQELKRRDDKQK